MPPTNEKLKTAKSAIMGLFGSLPQHATGRHNFLRLTLVGVCFMTCVVACRTLLRHRQFILNAKTRLNCGGNFVCLTCGAAAPWAWRVMTCLVEHLGRGVLWHSTKHALRKEHKNPCMGVALSALRLDDQIGATLYHT